MKPKILIVYYSFTNQTRRVAEAMAGSFRDHGCEVCECAIEFTDERYQMQLPMVPFYRKLLGWVPRQLSGRIGEIRVPDEVADDDYDLICVGSPTWWLNPAMPVRSFMKSDAATRLLNGKPFAVFAVCRALWWNNVRNVRKLGMRCGGKFVQAAGFCFRGNQVQSMLTFINYLKTGQDRDRSWGIKIYEFGVPEDGLEHARDFAKALSEECSIENCPTD